VNAKTIPSVFEVGSTVDGYEFLAILDNSTNGVSYKVRNVSAQRLEILKVLACHSEYSLESEERFVREAHVHARLVHPHIICFYRAAILQERLVMTAEFVEGVTLAQRLEAGPRFWREGLDCASQVLSALGYAHSHAVMHRHVTPENIILTQEGPVKLTGFDLAKGLKDKKLTDLGVVVGEAKYMSPEQVKGLQVFDIRSDIYSLGVVLFEAVTGVAPFESKSQFDLMLAHVKSVPAPPSRINPSIPSEVDSIILKALEKEPAKRFQSADEFRSAITGVMQKVLPVSGVTAVPTVAQHPAPVAQEPPPAVPAPLFAEMPSSSKLTIVAALLLIGAIVLVALRL
jgi:serine/threonine protein kinase